MTIVELSMFTTAKLEALMSSTEQELTKTQQHLATIKAVLFNREIDETREDFEEWLQPRSATSKHSLLDRHNNSGEYKLHRTQKQWAAYRAGREHNS